MLQVIATITLAVTQYFTIGGDDNCNIRLCIAIIIKFDTGIYSINVLGHDHEPFYQ